MKRSIYTFTVTTVREIRILADDVKQATSFVRRELKYSPDQFSNEGSGIKSEFSISGMDETFNEDSCDQRFDIDAEDFNPEEETLENTGDSILGKHNL